MIQRRLPIILSIIIITTSCKKSNTNSVNIPTVYVAGNYGDTAVYWKNGVRHNLSRGQANSILLSNKDVYISGIEYLPAVAAATYWKNEIPTTYLNDFNRLSYSTYAFSMCVKDNDIYVTGAVDAPDGLGIAAYWKNGAITLLTDDTRNSTGRAIAVSGNDIYVAGNQFDSTGAVSSVYWKNNIVYNLVGGTVGGVANSVFIANSDIFFGGWISGMATWDTASYWKNGQLVNLNSVQNNFHPYQTNAIYVSEGDVYNAGIQYANSISIATYWKNGTAFELSGTDQNSSANSIFVKGNDIYIAGYTTLNGKKAATIWKNGVASVLTDQRVDATANSVFVE